MEINYAAPWHRASFEKLVNERLPELLAARGPLLGYHAESDEGTSCRISVVLATANGADDIALTFTLPQPNGEGLFILNELPHVVVPLATSEYLEEAEIHCAGEQLFAFIAERLTETPASMLRDESVARAWLSLDLWWEEFLATHAQRLDTVNWLSEYTHLRRLAIPQREHVLNPGHYGRVCLFEMPEGPNIGHIFSIALGAQIIDGRLVIVDDSPEAALGLTASMAPFLEHNDANRQLFGVNMMRQWIRPMQPEPALVQTGNEPAAAGFWCGYNLLTAFVSWGEDTYEDALLISESCAKRLQYSTPVEPGDKFSNRHGAKGVISRIVPDAEMPHLADGTPIELVYNFIALHPRMNFGQIREALMSRITQPAIVPPFHAPGEDELRRSLAATGLPEDGMEQLYHHGQPLERRSMVGRIYWGRTVHLAEGKIHAAVTPEGSVQLSGEMEYYIMRDLGAFATIRETYNTRAAGRPDAATLAVRVAAGPISQAPPPSPGWAAVTHRLMAAGIHATLTDGQLTFRFASPEEDVISLARPVPHPWLPERELTEIGVLPDVPESAAVAEANTRLARMITGGTPASLLKRATEELAERIRVYGDMLLSEMSSGMWKFETSTRASLLHFSARVLFSARTVLAPGVGLRLDQLGVAEEIAWTLFGPLAARKMGNSDEVAARTEHAAAVLDAVMAESWVLLNRAPTYMPTALIAFRPVRIPGRVIRLHPLACPAMNADYDGDQAAIFLPLTEEGQREAAELFSIAGHLRRDPSLLKWFSPNQEMVWGLAAWSMTPAGRTKLAGLISPEGYITRDSLNAALQDMLCRDGVDAALEYAQQLMHKGLELVRNSGASLNPFIGKDLAVPAPEQDTAEGWQRSAEEMAELLAACTDFTGDLGPQILAVKTGARGNLHHFQWIIGPRGTVRDVSGKTVIVRHGYRDGLTPEELFACVAGAREGLMRLARETYHMAYGIREPAAPKGFTVLARAMRADHPGLVFAHAAATGEVDPLTDLDSRLFVGLPVK